MNLNLIARKLYISLNYLVIDLTILDKIILYIFIYKNSFITLV